MVDEGAVDVHPDSYRVIIYASSLSIFDLSRNDEVHLNTTGRL